MNTALLLILGIPLIEIYLFIKVGSEIGAVNTILLILTTAIVGVWYARYEGFIHCVQACLNYLKMNYHFMK